MEFIPRKNENLELRLLSAITKVPKVRLTGIVESSLEEKLRESGISFEKKEQQHGTLTKISEITKKEVRVE